METEIVLATRFGASSADPARVAADLARRTGGRVTVLYVATELEALELGASEAGVDPDMERKRVQRRIENELRTFIEEWFAGVPASVRIVEGDVADQVARAARDTNAAYIVVGTRGRGQIARLMLGDTTQTILQRAPCPVVVVPLRHTDR
jgi:nucleotide-binding universal stress UspA family protein